MWLSIFAFVVKCREKLVYRVFEYHLFEYNVFDVHHQRSREDLEKLLDDFGAKGWRIVAVTTPHSSDFARVFMEKRRES